MLDAAHAPGAPPAKNVDSAVLVQALSSVRSLLTVEWPVNGTCDDRRARDPLRDLRGVLVGRAEVHLAVEDERPDGGQRRRREPGAGDASGQPMQYGIGPPATAAAGENGPSCALGIALAAAVTSS